MNAKIIASLEKLQAELAKRNDLTGLERNALHQMESARRLLTEADAHRPKAKPPEPFNGD